MSSIYSKQETAECVLLYEQLKMQYPQPPDREELSRQIIFTQKCKCLQSPLAVMENTWYGSKDKYKEIAAMWMGREGTPQGWEFLCLVNTLEQMDVSIYEYYRMLQDLVKKWAPEVLAREQQDIFSAIAVLKACCLDALNPEHYANAGKQLLPVQEAFSREGGTDQELQLKTGKALWALADYYLAELKNTWGFDGEDDGE